MNSPQVAIADKFMFALTQLPRQTQKKTLEFVTKFRQDPRSAGINYEKINLTCDPQYRSVRIDQNYRGIIRAPDQGNVYLLLWVDKHDDAYDWARRHTCEVHSGTGTLQIYESIVTEEAANHQATEHQQTIADASPSMHEAAEPVVSSEAAVAIEPEPEQVVALAFDLTDQQLSQIGVPSAMVPLVQAIRSEADLEALETRLPVEAFEPLYLMAAGASWEEIESDYLTSSESTIDTEDLEAALHRPSSQRQFWLVEDDLELQAMLNAPLDRWRVFLHPSQRKLIERHWNGPVRVLGGAGTGKTVVAMHRARWLVKQLAGSDRKVLFTTFTVNLATDIAENLRKICSAEELKKIEVMHIDGWVSNFLKRQKYPHQIVYESSSKEYANAWESALVLASVEGLNHSFYREEWERVVLPQRVHTKAEYFKASRIGRGVPLNRRQRADIWPVFEELRSQLHHKGLKTFEDATLDVVDILSNQDVRLPYSHVIVDEAQDMGPQALTLIRQLVKESKDDLFIVGDGHQRIYRRKAVMSKCGIQIVGRSRKLKINYRTTEETRKFACRVLEGFDVDDLDGGHDGQSDYRSLVHGQKPVIMGFSTREEENAGVASEIKKLLDDGVEARDICVVARTGFYRNGVGKALEGAGISTVQLKGQTDNRNIDGVRLATMHRVKGLEFRYVFLAAISQGVVPLKVAVSSTEDPVEQRQSEMNERALLHVAATRAVRGLYVSYSGEMSEFLK